MSTTNSSTTVLIPFARVSPTPGAAGGQRRGENSGQTPGREHAATVRAPSALAKLRALLARLINVDGPSLETDLLCEYTTEAAQGLVTAHDLSTQAETRVERLRRHWAQFWADKQITPAEARILAQDQRALAAATQQTTNQLNTLR